MLSLKKNYVLSLLGNSANTILAVVVGVLSIPISLSYWQVEKFGALALINSVVVYFMLAGLGAPATATILASKAPLAHTKKLILARSLKICLLGTSVVFGFITATFFFVPGWIRFLGSIPQGLASEAGLAAYILISFCLLNIPFALTSSVFQSLQKSYKESPFILLATSVPFLVLLIVTAMRLDLVQYSLLIGVSSTLLNLVKGHFALREIRRDQVHIDAEPSEADEARYRQIWRLCLRNLGLNFATLAVTGIDAILISHTLGLSEVTAYSVTSRFFLVLSAIGLVLGSSSLPLIAREYGRGNNEWVSTNFSRVQIFTAVVTGAIWIGATALGADVIRLWAGDAGYAGQPTLVLLGGYGYLLSITNLNSSVLASMNKNQNTFWFILLEAVAKLSLVFALVPLFGLSAIAVAVFFAHLTTSFWINIVLLAKRAVGVIHTNKNFLGFHFVFVVVIVLFFGVLESMAVSTVLKIVIGLPLVAVYSGVVFLILPMAERRFIHRALKGIAQRLVSRGRKNVND